MYHKLQISIEQNISILEQSSTEQNGSVLEPQAGSSGLRRNSQEDGNVTSEDNNEVSKVEPDVPQGTIYVTNLEEGVWHPQTSTPRTRSVKQKGKIDSINQAKIMKPVEAKMEEIQIVDLTDTENIKTTEDSAERYHQQCK